MTTNQIYIIVTFLRTRNSVSVIIKYKKYRRRNRFDKNMKCINVYKFRVLSLRFDQSGSLFCLKYCSLDKPFIATISVAPYMEAEKYTYTKF